VTNPLSKAQLSEVNKGLYSLNEARQYIDLLESLGVDMDEKRLRMEHLEQQLKTLRDTFSKQSA